MEYLFLIATGIWVATGIYWIVAAQNIKPARKKEEIGFRVAYLVLWFLPVIVTFFPVFPEGVSYARMYPKDDLIELLAFVGMLVGLSFMIWSRVELGRNWSGRIAIKENHELITTGPYAYARHPMYTGFIFAFAFSALLLGEWRGAIAFVLLIIGILIKLQKEERIVRKAFGLRYEDYASRVKQLIPFVY